MKTATGKAKKKRTPLQDLMKAERGTPRKRIKQRRTKPRKGVLKDPKYLAFIAQQPCFICSTTLERDRKRKTPAFCLYPELWMYQVGRTEVAHVGDRGLGQKCSDRETLPICERHHRTGPLALHKLGKKFWTHFGIDKAAQLSYYQSLYESQEVER